MSKHTPSRKPGISRTGKRKEPANYTPGERCMADLARERVAREKYYANAEAVSGGERDDDNGDIDPMMFEQEATMKKITKRQREMSQETLDHLNWEINNLKFGIKNGVDNHARLFIVENLVAQAIVICKTDDEFGDICENSWR